MDQPFYNPNASDENPNNNFTGNQYQEPNQGQDNQLYMMPPGINLPPPEQQNSNLDMANPEQPYYAPHPTQIPINSQQNQPISSPSPVYYTPPQIAQNPQPQPQPYSQGVPSVQPVPNYPTQNNGILVQAQGIPQNNYQNYQNINQVRHQGITQKDQNTFKISSGYQGPCLPLCLIIFGIIFFIYGIMGIIIGANISGFIIIGIILFIIGLILYNNKKVYFIMGPNNLTVINKQSCSKKVDVYNPGQLLRVDFIYNAGGGSYLHNYILNIVLSNGQVINVFTHSGNSPKFTLEEISYFLYFINNHIQNKMRV